MAWAIVNFLGKSGYVKHGSIRFMGRELVGVHGEALRRLRGDQIAMVYQDPMQALNPSMRVGDQLKEVVTVHNSVTDREADRRCIEMLERVYMPDAADVMRRYPHQISGGQQQRVVIGMALLNSPALLIMDEPTTALDVTVEAAVLDLIGELRRDIDTAILYITHNLGVVARVCDRVAVMYSGEVVELAAVNRLFAEPEHPYTQGLMRCVPKIGVGKDSSVLYPIPGRVPPPEARPEGCTFGPRCEYAVARCAEERPGLRQVGTGTRVRCHFAEDIDPAQWQPTIDFDGTDHATRRDAENGDSILRVDHLQKYYSVRGNSFKDVIGLGEKKMVKALEDVSILVGTWKHARRCRRVWLRQEHTGAHDYWTRRKQRGACHVPRF